MTITKHSLIVLSQSAGILKNMFHMYTVVDTPEFWWTFKFSLFVVYTVQDWTQTQILNIILESNIEIACNFVNLKSTNNAIS